MAAVIVNIISKADNSGFAKAARSMTSLATKATAIAGAVSVAGAAVGSLGVGLAGVGALATPALAAVVVGMDGIKKAAQAASGPAQKLKSTLTNEFATGMVKGFTDLGAVLTGITPQMQGVARAVSGTFNGLAATIRQNIPALQQLTAGAGKFVTALGPGLNSMVSGLISFGAQAARSAQQVGTAFGGVLGKIGQAFAKLPVDALMQSFVGVLNGLGNAIGPLINLVAQLAVAMGPTLGQLFTQLGSTITALTPALSALGAAFGSALVQVLPAITPALTAVGQAMATLVTAATPLIVVLANIASAVLTGLGPALPAVVAGIAAFVVGIKALMVVSTVATSINALSTAMTGLGIASKLGPALAVVRGGFMAAAASTWAWTAALLANPITWIVIAIIALIAVIVLIATKTTWFQTIWAAMCTAARAAWDFVVNAVKVGIQVLQAIWGAIVAYFTMQWNIIQAVASAVWNAIVAVVQFAIGVVQAVVGAVVAFISAQWQMMQAAASAVWNAIQAVVSAVMNGVQAVVSGVINVITSAFQGLQSIGSAVFGAIAGAARAFGSAVSSIIGFVQRLISAIASIRFPSPPSWLTSLFGGEYATGPGLVAFMTPPSALQLSPDALHLAQGFPSLTGMGALAGRGGVTINQDNSTTVKVDGSGIVDANAVAASVTYATSRTRRTTGAQYAMRLGS